MAPPPSSGFTPTLTIDSDTTTNTAGSDGTAYSTFPTVNLTQHGSVDLKLIVPLATSAGVLTGLVVIATLLCMRRRRRNSTLQAEGMLTVFSVAQQLTSVPLFNLL